MLTRGHRGYSIAFLALVLMACALPALLVAACEPTHQAPPAPDAAASPTAAPLNARRGIQAGATASPANWTQLGQFLGWYDCTSTANPSYCAATDAFILANDAGPDAALYSAANGGTTLQNTQLIASATKMPAAAAILHALYKNKYTISTPVDTILTNYTGANPSDAAAATFMSSWTAMEKAISKRYNKTSTSPQIAITMQQLLSMTSGFTTLSPSDVLLQPSCMVDPTCANPPNTQCTDPYTQVSLATCAAQIAGQGAKVLGVSDPGHYIVFQPGTKFGYSFASYQVAGYVATLLPTSSGTYPHAGNWISFFNDTFAKPLGLLCPKSSTSTSCYSYANDLVQYPMTPTPAGPTAPVVTNPRVAGGASSDAYSYSTILTMILNNGVYDGKQVLSQEVVKLLQQNQLQNQLPDTCVANPKDADDGLSSSCIYYLPFVPASYIRGYSFGLFIPTSKGVVTNGQGAGFFVNLSSAANPSPGGGTLTPADLTTPAKSGTTFMDPGLFGTVGWFNTDPANRFSAVSVIFEDVKVLGAYAGDTNLVGLDMMRGADSAISCQAANPGGPQPTPGQPPPGGTYCVAPAP